MNKKPPGQAEDQLARLRGDHGYRPGAGQQGPTVVENKTPKLKVVIVWRFLLKFLKNMDFVGWIFLTELSVDVFLFFNLLDFKDEMKMGETGWLKLLVTQECVTPAKLTMRLPTPFGCPFFVLAPQLQGTTASFTHLFCRKKTRAYDKQKLKWPTIQTWPNKMNAFFRMLWMWP